MSIFQPDGFRFHILLKWRFMIKNCIPSNHMFQAFGPVSAWYPPVDGCLLHWLHCAGRHVPLSWQENLINFARRSQRKIMTCSSLAWCGSFPSAFWYSQFYQEISGCCALWPQCIKHLLVSFVAAFLVFFCHRSSTRTETCTFYLIYRKEYLCPSASAQEA